MVTCFANCPMSYTFNIGLDNTMTWTAQAKAVSLDYAVIFDGSNTNLSAIGATVDVTNPNLPNPNNFAVTLSANSHQTQWYITGGVDPQERTLILQTVLTSNTGQIVHANNVYLRVLNSAI